MVFQKSACIEPMYGELPFLERFQAAKDGVLNDRPHVNEAVRQRVLAAMRELGYLSPRETYRRLLTIARNVVFFL
mgnify:CR=1 FL=1